jgi:hypothetical protein
LRRNDFGAGLTSPSDEGGFEELLEFNPNRRFNSALSARNFSLSARSWATSARSCAIT